MASVRIYAYSGLIDAPLLSGGRRPVSDAVFLYKEPYLAGEVLEPTTGSPATSSANTAPAETTILRLQVDGGKRVHYEVTPQGFDLRLATTNSPITSDDDIIRFSEGWRISLLEVTE